VIASSVPAFSAGVVRVRLEDVSYADRRATIVAEASVPGVAHDPATADRVPQGPGTVVPFSLTPSRDIESDHDYSVRAWLDRAGRSPDSAELHSDRTYPVLTRGFGSDVTVVLGS
jgi:hypothetical protein